MGKTSNKAERNRLERERERIEQELADLDYREQYRLEPNHSTNMHKVLHTSQEFTYRRLHRGYAALVLMWVTVGFLLIVSAAGYLYLEHGWREQFRWLVWPILAELVALAYWKLVTERMPI